MNIAGFYDEETHKDNNVRKSENIRDRREYERIALGGIFKIIKYYGNLDLLMNIDDSIKGKPLRIIIPNKSFIKSHIKNTLRKQLQINNSKKITLFYYY